ncbi:hypothetical protein AB0D46_22140 [Streptomyces sp. NPDC048383]|uniref:hypothetical protein n=1 Tax=Streptomyces sp. NPDC048383 TaxID=3155386 RepID=UPI0034402B3E
MAREPLTGSVASLVNGAVEAFVRAAAIELPGRQRIDAVSPTAFTEAMDAYGGPFAGGSDAARVPWTTRGRGLGAPRVG